MLFVLFGAAYAAAIALAVHRNATNFSARMAAVPPKTPASDCPSPGTLAGPRLVDARNRPPTARRRVVWPLLSQSWGHTTPMREAS